MTTAKTDAAEPVIVTDTGFSAEHWSAGFIPLSEATGEDAAGLDVPSDTDPAVLLAHLAAHPGTPLLRIDFPTSADGRGFTLARLARAAGYSGRLRARGHVISDHYAMARRSGFDEVEIGAELAARQPEPHWLSRAGWRANDYQSRMRG